MAEEAFHAKSLVLKSARVHPSQAAKTPHSRAV